MKAQAKKATRGDAAVMYRGIRIAPIAGTRSKIAQYLRAALREKAQAESRGHRKPA
jgi:hypothetical protein